MSNWASFKELYNNTGHRKNADNFRYHFNQQFADISFTDKSILEVGCCQGFLSLYIALFTGATKITAIDESAGHGSEVGVLDVLRNNVAYLKLESRLEVIQADALEFKSGPFDIIIANNCLHHFVDYKREYGGVSGISENLQMMFQHFEILLNSCGKLIIQEIDPLNLWRFLCPKLVFPNTDWTIHPSLSEWLDALKKAGFCSIRLRTGIPYKLRFLRRFLSNRVFRLFMCGEVLIYCQKP